MKKIEIKTPVAILGFGVEGKAAYEFLKKEKIKDIAICDENESLELPDDIKSQLGKTALKDLTSFKTIIRSPGIHYDLPGIREAKDLGATVTSMTEFTLDTAKERLTAVTGSNGKTTVVSMITKILKAHYKDKIIVGGNDRKPVLQEALDHPDWPILMEVSSFQFADLQKSPHISAILNLTPNHLDWHEDLENYIHAKTNLIAHQTYEDWCVLNKNDQNSAKLGSKTPSKIFWLGKKGGNMWAVWEGNKVIVKWEDEEIEILEKSDLIVKTHPDNILGAVAISLIHDVDPKLIKEVLSKFKGAEHRLEFVREINGVKFYNDSACTTPESAKVAINQFPEGELILMLGGSSKNSDFSFLAHHIVESGTRVYLYGEEADRIKKAVLNEDGEHLILSVDGSGDFSEIIKRVQQMAEPGDNIVLSPACASFDMFKNSKERGEEFKKIVDNLD